MQVERRLVAGARREPEEGHEAGEVGKHRHHAGEIEAASPGQGHGPRQLDGVDYELRQHRQGEQRDRRIVDGVMRPREPAPPPARQEVVLVVE